jgi:hypothetical protein
MRGRALRLGAVAAVTAALFALRVPLCPFAILTRHPCPGCGLTRAALALASGQIDAALHFHPLVLPLVPLTALVLIQGSYNYVRHGRWRTVEFVQNRWLTIASICMGVAMMGVWLARFFGAFGGPVPVS